jgi:hypothetical protein
MNMESNLSLAPITVGAFSSPVRFHVLWLNLVVRRIYISTHHQTLI